MTVKVAEVAVPPGVVTVMEPVVAPAGTLVEIVVPFVTVNAALVPWNFTEPALRKFVPVIVTGVLTTPAVGLSEVMVGAGAAGE